MPAGFRYVIAHGVIDAFVPFPSVAQQALELDRLGYRYRFTAYPFEGHISFVLKDDFDDAVAHMGTGLRQPDPGHITFGWYPQLSRNDLGIGPHQVWWLSALKAGAHITATRGAIAEVDARSYARPDRTRTVRRRSGLIPGFDPSPGLFTELSWQVGPEVDPLPYLTLKLTGIASLTVDVARAGLAALRTSTIQVATDTATQVTLAALAPGTTIEVDGRPTGSQVAVPFGRHRIALTRRPE